MTRHITALVSPSGPLSAEISREITEIVWNTLPLEGDGKWQYYNFTSDTSIWDSDERGKSNHLCLAYVEVGSDDLEDIQFCISIPPNGFSEQLAKLKAELIRKFGLLEVSR